MCPIDRCTTNVRGNHTNDSFNLSSILIYSDSDSCLFLPALDQQYKRSRLISIY